MNNRLKGVNDISALRVDPTMVVWDLDETDASGASEGSTSNDDEFGLYSSNSLDETTTPPVRNFFLGDEDSIWLHRSALAEGLRTVSAEGSPRSVMRGIRSSANMPMSQEFESLDLDDLLRSEEQDDHSSVMTHESVDFEEFEVDLNDEPGPRYRSIQGSCNFYRVALSLGLGNHDSGYSGATDDDSSCCERSYDRTSSN
jgi:hypothetical protein